MQRHQELRRRLEALHPAAPGSREEIDLSNDLAWELVPVDIARAREIALRARDQARSLSHAEGEARAAIVLASDDFYAARYDAALEKARYVVEACETSGDDVGRARMLLIRALVGWGVGDYEPALEDLHVCEEIARRTEEVELLGWTLTSQGGIFEMLSDASKAASLHLRAYHTFLSAGYSVGVGRALSGLGSVYYRQGRLDAALEQHLEARDIFRAVPSELSEARALNDLGIVYRAKGDVVRARRCLDEALEIRRRFGNRPAVLTTLIHLGELALDVGEPLRALELLGEAARVAEEARTQPKLQQALASMSRAHEALGEWAEALSAQRRSQATKEAVLSDEAATRIKNLQIRHAVDKAEREAEIQRLRNVELADALARLERAQAQLVQSEKLAALGRLVAAVTHEMNTPTGVITSSIDVTRRLVARLLTRTDGDSAQRRELEALGEATENASRAASRLGEIAERLKAFSRVDQSDYQSFDLNRSVQVTLDLVRSQWPAGLRVTKDAGELPELRGYPAALNQALMTLLLNAGEATGEGGHVAVATQRVDGGVELVVSDDGRGMSASELETLFEVGLDRTGYRVRMRTGLATVRAVTEMHGGSIDVESREGQGTRFVIVLPLVAPHVD